MTFQVELTLDKAQSLEASRIIAFKGVSGVETDAETAFDVPMLCQMHSLAGDVFDLDTDNGTLVATRRE